jgi:hypothetical protein
VVGDRNRSSDRAWDCVDRSLLCRCGDFGLLNDVCNGVEAILSAVLAWALYPVYRAQSARSSGLTLIAARVGALIATIGSALIIFDFTGWYLAGLYTMFGYALVGVWLFGLNYAGLQSYWWPRRLAQLGLLTAICMALGFLAGPGILAGVDDTDAAPWFVNIGLLGSLGWMFVYPCWCLWLGNFARQFGVTSPRSSASYRWPTAQAIIRARNAGLG